VKGKSGIILIDLLMAVVIVGVAAVAAVELLTASGKAGRYTENLQTATSLCREKLEQIRNIPSLTAGTGFNTGDPFLPNLTNVSTDSYLSGFYLTESDTYQASNGTPGSLTAMRPPARVDRITQIQWIDDPTGGGAQDYYRVTVTVLWPDRGETRMLSMETLVNGN
jgi:type II secretory pathway pseudopilin PulG